MAATTAADYPIIAKLVEGYVQANFSHRASLVTSGAMLTIPQTSLSYGNTWVVRGRGEYHDDWQTPTANTDLTVNDLSHYKDIGVILRRADAFGIEDAAAVAAGDQQAIAAVGEIILDAFNYQLERTIFEQMLPGLFGTGGILDSTTYKVVSASSFTHGDISLARKVMGANAQGLSYLFMHSDVFYGNEYDRITTNVDWETQQEFARQGINYGGMLGGAMVILNDLCYNSGGVYHSYLTRRGALGIGFQKSFGTEAYRDVLKAGGTDVVKYDTYFSPVVFGTSYTGTAPTTIGGATDANLLATANWSLRADQDGTSLVKKGTIGIVAIETVG